MLADILTKNLSGHLFRQNVERLFYCTLPH
jgi:hypothetical protein